jgi:hypothetical protein
VEMSEDLLIVADKQRPSSRDMFHLVCSQFGHLVCQLARDMFGHNGFLRFPMCLTRRISGRTTVTDITLAPSAMLIPVEQAMHVIRRKELYEKLHPETKRGGAPAKKGKGGGAGKQSSPGHVTM